MVARIEVGGSQWKMLLLPLFVVGAGELRPRIEPAPHRAEAHRLRAIARVLEIGCALALEALRLFAHPAADGVARLVMARIRRIGAAERTLPRDGHGAERPRA